MFLLGILVIVSSLIYLLATNNERNTLYIFASVSIAYFIFGYGVPLSEVYLLITESGSFDIVLAFLSIIVVFYLIEKYENTIFPFDYSLVLRSFFFRFETITLALYLIGILFSSGNLIIDFLVLVTIVRLANVDKFISYIVLNAVLFTNAIFVYPVANATFFETTKTATDLMHNNSLLVAIVIPAFMLVLYVSGFLVRSLEKEIFIEMRIVGIIALSAAIGVLGHSVLSSSELLIYIPLLALILLSLNDLNVRKKFSRYSKIPLALSILLLFALILTIYISAYSFIVFIICAILVNSSIANEKYQKKEVLYNPDKIELKTLAISVVLILTIVLFANNSIYNATAIGVPYVNQAINEVITGSSNVLVRTYELFANSAYFTMQTPRLLDPTLSSQTVQYLLIAIPALAIISVPTQLLLLMSTGYKTKISGEVLIGVMLLGLVTITLISYAIGV